MLAMQVVIAVYLVLTGTDVWFAYRAQQRHEGLQQVVEQVWP
jgi:hypothetical protein